MRRIKKRLNIYEFESCPICGYHVSLDNRFCPNCGQNLYQDPRCIAIQGIRFPLKALKSCDFCKYQEWRLIGLNLPNPERATRRPFCLKKEKFIRSYPHECEFFALASYFNVKNKDGEKWIETINIKTDDELNNMRHFCLACPNWEHRKSLLGDCLIGKIQTQAFEICPMFHEYISKNAMKLRAQALSKWKCSDLKKFMEFYEAVKKGFIMVEVKQVTNKDISRAKDLPIEKRFAIEPKELVFLRRIAYIILQDTVERAKRIGLIDKCITDDLIELFNDYDTYDEFTILINNTQKIKIKLGDFLKGTEPYEFLMEENGKEYWHFPYYNQPLQITVFPYYKIQEKPYLVIYRKIHY